MRILSLKNIRLLFGVALLVLVISISSNAQTVDIVERDYLYDEDDNSFNSDLQVSKHKEKKRKATSRLELKDSAFENQSSVTFKNLVIKVTLLTGFLLIILVLVKIYLRRESLGKVGTLVNELSQKFSPDYTSFAGFQGLKLNQTIVLTPGQNLYLVEANGKKLLLGGTHNGGVQLLTDLSGTELQNQLSFKLIDDLTGNKSAVSINNGSNLIHSLSAQDFLNSPLPENPFSGSTAINKNETNSTTDKKAQNGNNLISNENKHSKFSLKKRNDFRQSLLNELQKAK